MGPRIAYNPSPLSLISLHYHSVGKRAGFVTGLSVLVPSLHSHSAEIITAAHFANSCPHTRLLNLFLVKKAGEHRQTRRSLSQLKNGNQRPVHLMVKNGHFNTLSSSQRPEAKTSPKQGLLPSRILPFSRGSDTLAGNGRIRCQGQEYRCRLIHSACLSQSRF